MEAYSAAGREGESPQVEAREGGLRSQIGDSISAVDVLESTADPVIVFDRCWRILYISCRAAQVLGVEFDQVLGKPVWDVFPGDFDSAFRDACGRTWAEGKPIAVEHYCSALSLWVESYICPRYDGASVQWRYASEYQRARRTLLQTQERLQTAIKAAELSTWEVDLDTGSVKHFGPSGLLTHSDPDGVGDQHWTANVHPDDRERLVRELWRAIESGSNFVTEYRVTTPEGGTRWMLARAVAQHRSRAPRRMIGVAQDITAYHEATSDLDQQRELVQSLLQNLPVMLYVYNPESEKVEINREFERVLGYGGPEARGPDVLAPVHAAIANEQSGDPEPTWREVIVTANDGSTIATNWASIHLLDGRILGIGLDLRAAKRNEDAVREYEAQLRSIEHLVSTLKADTVGVFAGGVAHNFNNLLVGVLGNASLALELVPAEDAVAERLRSILESGERAAQLAKQILAYAGKGQFVSLSINVSELVHAVAQSFTLPGRCGIELGLDPGLPTIEGDPAQIQQLIETLIENAAEAIGEKEGIITVQTGVRDVDEQFSRELQQGETRPGRHVFLKVLDNGCGMDAVTKTKIFDPFFTTKFTGRGLGLAAVAGIVRAHKGGMRVQSAPGRGTSISVLFPAASHAESSADSSGRG